MKRVWMILFSLLLFLVININVNAEVLSFSVEIIPHDMQTGSNKGYFDLLVQPDSSHKVTVLVHNNEPEVLSIRADIVNASTGINGSNGVYEVETNIDASMKYPLTELLKESKTVEVAPNSTVSMEFELNMPKESFIGKVIGGIRFSVLNDNLEALDSKNGFIFENHINYIIGVQVQNSLEVPSKSLNLVSNGISSVSFKPVFTSTIQNDKAIHMGLVEIYGEIYDSNKNVVAKVDVKQSQILPNTSFDVAYTPVGNKIESGKYSMYLKIRHHDDIWEWNEDFTISLGDIDKVNEEVQQVYPDTSPNYLPWIIGLMGLFLLIIILLLFLLFKRRKKDEEEETLDHE